MKDLMMHISQHPGILVDVLDPTNPNKKLILGKDGKTAIAEISQLLSQRPYLKVRTYLGNPTNPIEPKTFTISLKKETSEIEKTSPQHTVMSDPNITAQLLVLQAENKWLKSSHDRLERENSELRVNTEKLRIENNELTIRTSVADREKQLALQQQEISNKPKGLSGLAEPSAIKEIVSGLAEAVRAFKGNDSGNNNSQNQLSGGNGLSQAKQEVVDFFISKLGDTVTDEQANKIAFLLKTMIEKDKVDHLFSLWSEPVNNNSNA
jgi:hypothetical protein